MDWSSILLSLVAAAGTLTPLTLGMLNYSKDKKKEAEKPAINTPSAILGETVDFESIAVQSLNAQIKMLQDAATEKDARNAELKAQRDANARALRNAGLNIPDT